MNTKNSVGKKKTLDTEPSNFENSPNHFLCFMCLLSVGTVGCLTDFPPRITISVKLSREAVNPIHSWWILPLWQISPYTAFKHCYGSNWASNTRVALKDVKDTLTMGSIKAKHCLIVLENGHIIFWDYSHNYNTKIK